MAKMRIVHFDVDSALFPYLSGERYEFSLQKVSWVKNYSSIEAVSIKSQSKAEASTLDKLPKLKLLVTRTVGIDHLDLVECKKRRIAVYHLVDYGAHNIAEHTFALLLAGTRKIIAGYERVKSGQFNYRGLLGVSLHNKILGVVGTGKIGLAVIRLAAAFGMRVVAYDVVKNEQARVELGFSYVSFAKLLRDSDVITLHVPLLPETRRMINATAIKKMKPGVILVNTARGELIDETALVKHHKKFSFIGLDVLKNEAGFKKTSPLLKCKNIIITPHIAFYSDVSVKKIAAETTKCIANFCKGDISARVI